MSALILYYDGQLNVAEDFNPSYIGGRNKPLQVNSTLTLEELKLRVIHTLCRDSSVVTVNLVARIRNNGGFAAITVDDDACCEFILTQSRRRNVVIYVEFVALSQEDITRQPTSSRAASQVVRRSSSQPTNIQETAIGGNELREQPSSYDMHVSEGIPTILTHEVNAYESMSSASTEHSSDADVGCVGNDQSPINTRNVQGVEQIRDHAFQNISNLDEMIVNNDYIHTVQTAEEWDATEACDEPAVIVDSSAAALYPEQLTEGLTFPNKGALQFAVTAWSISKNVEFKKICSNSSRLTIICRQHDDPERPCLWRLHASKSKRLRGNWIISTTTQPHTCFHPISNRGHKNCNAKFICYFITAIIRHQIDLKPKEIIARMESKFNIKVSYIKAWNARKKAIKAVFGSYEDSYASLIRLFESIRQTNPGTVYNVQMDEGRCFKGLFWAFGTSIEGWRHCRPVLSLDGTFLLGKYRGTLLAAVGFDGNGGLYPLAFAIVESESIETWMWFMQKLYHQVPPTRSRTDLCFISDKHPGIIRACEEIYPNAAHRHCLRHLRENFKKAVRRMAISDCETICSKMYTAGNTDDMDIFIRNMSEIQQISQEAYNWLCARDFAKWTLSHDGGCRYGVMTTNASECFNGVLRRARGLPIQGLVISIYYNLVALFLKRTSNVQSWIEARTSTNVPRMTNTLVRLEEGARRCPEAICINNEEFQVFDMACRSFRVDILSPDTVACACNKPQLYHYPCVHAIAAASSKRWNYNIFVSSYYTLNSYKETYASQFHTIQDKSQWPPYDEDNRIIPLLPPPISRKPGRPRSARIRNTMDEPRPSSGRKCGLCRQHGHNRSTCPLNVSL